jgi:hypothetical protein
MIDTGSREERLQLREILRCEYEVRGMGDGRADALSEAAILLADPEDVTSPMTREQLKSAIEILSDDRNTVVYDDFGLPSVMVRIPLLREKDVLFGSDSDVPHPAFAGSEAEYLVGKYQCSLLGGQACSLPMAKPHFGVSFDEAQRLCRQKGRGWNLNPYALHMGIAMWCRKSGSLPRGNNTVGQDYFMPQEKGVPVGNGQTLCGSGPASWAHDGTVNGIYDFNGNLNEWDDGFRLLNGEIQVIPTEELLLADAETGIDSPLWRAIDETGALVAPGTPGTLKYDTPDGHIRLTRISHALGIGNSAFAEIVAEPGLTPPKITELLGLYPQAGRDGYGCGWHWVSTYGEVMPLCGGAHRANDHAGMFFVGASYPRTKDYDLTGFRLIYRV